MKKPIFLVNAVCLILLLIYSLSACTPSDEIFPPEADDISVSEPESTDIDLTEPEEENIYQENKIIAVSAGENHTMALDNNGNVWACGDNLFGQVGDGNISTYHEPIYEKIDPYSEYAEMIDGLIRDIDNDVYTPKLIMDNVKAIFAREHSSFAITNDNKLYAWGKNEVGQLGDGTTEDKSTPTFIMDDVLYIDSGRNQTTIIIKTDNTLWVAGRSFGMSGIGWEIYQTPIMLYENVKKAALDNSCSTGLGGILILTTDNKVVSYEPEELYSDTYIFKELSNFHDSVDIASALQQTYVLDINGDVYGWGANGSDGSLGARDEEWFVDEPILIASDIKKILQGRFFIKNDDTLLTWGTVATTQDTRGTHGEYGGSLTGELIAYGGTPVSILENIDAADGRRFHFIALDNDGNVYTWGQNFYGQLGNGGSENQTGPAQIIFPFVN